MPDAGPALDGSAQPVYVEVSLMMHVALQGDPLTVLRCFANTDLTHSISGVQRELRRHSEHGRLVAQPLHPEALDQPSLGIRLRFRYLAVESEAAIGHVRELPQVRDHEPVHSVAVPELGPTLLGDRQTRLIHGPLDAVLVLHDRHGRSRERLRDLPVGGHDLARGQKVGVENRRVVELRGHDDADRVQADGWILGHLRVLCQGTRSRVAQAASPRDRLEPA